MSAVNTEPEVRKKIEDLTDDMLEQIKDAYNNKDKLAYFMMCKHRYLLTVLKLKAFKDMGIIDFPESSYSMLPETENKILGLIGKWHAAKTADLKAPYYRELKMMCHEIEKEAGR